MIHRKQRTFEEQIISAQDAIGSYHFICPNNVCNVNNPFSENLTNWLQCLLEILKKKKYATIQTKNGKLIDVQRIAYTYEYASFFDVYNNIKIFNTDCNPVITNKLENKIR